jgi:hypothetical protein
MSQGVFKKYIILFRALPGGKGNIHLKMNGGDDKKGPAREGGALSNYGCVLLIFIIVAWVPLCFRRDFR